MKFIETYEFKSNITKTLILDILKKFKLNCNNIKYVGHGSFGKAFKCCDKIIKITSDPVEIKYVSKLIGKNRNGIVKYYNIMKISNNIYAFSMDYILPIEKYIRTNNYDENFVNYITDVIYFNWNNIKNFNDFLNFIEEHYILKKNTIDYVFVYNFYKLFKKLKQLKMPPDFHIGNIGIDSNGDYLLYDFRLMK